MLGERIRKARVELGMSQQQLAGDDMSRSFICRIEQGKVRPSLKTLKIIAARLGKPLEYFTLGDSEQSERLELIRVLLRTAERSLAARECDQALAAAESAVRLSETVDDPELEMEARLQLLRVYEKVRRHEAAMEAAEEVIRRCQGARHAPVLAEVYLVMGNVRFQQGDFVSARQYYMRSLAVTRDRKSLLPLAARAHINLGSCLYRLGEPEAAIGAYREALELCRLGAGLDLQGLANLGLGWVLHQTGRTQEGLKATAEALRVLKELDHPSAVYAQHNLAVIRADLNQWQEALPLLEECLQVYEKRKEFRLKAYVLEEFARYHLVHGRADETLQYCQRGLKSLDAEDDTLIRARLYRMAAQAHRMLGNTQRAHDLALLSLELFRRLKAREEMESTRRLLAESPGDGQMQDPVPGVFPDFGPGAE